MRYEKIWYQLLTFFITIHCFSLIKAAMNAPRLCPRHWPCRNGVYKKPQCLNFPIAKLAIKKPRRRTNTLKGSQRTGGGQNSLKIPRTSPFNKDLSNETPFSPIHLAGQYL